MKIIDVAEVHATLLNLTKRSSGGRDIPSRNSISKPNGLEIE